MSDDGAAPVSAYRQAREQGEQALYEAVLALASELISREGAAALSMRRLATAAGCSTTVLYNLFGSKHGIVEALFSEGFRRISAAHAGVVASGDPIADVLRLAEVYREVALAYPTHYRIMFGGAVPGYVPSAEAKQAAMAGMQPLMAALAAAQAAGRLETDDVAQFGVMFWSVAHGFVSLELAGMSVLPADNAALYRAALVRFLGGEVPRP